MGSTVGGEVILPFQLNDGGCYLSSHPHEKHDCVVAGLAIVTQLPYDLIYEVLREAGRKPNQGFESDVWLKKRRGKVLGGQFRQLISKRSSFTPFSFGTAHPKGRFLLESPTHTWAMVDGVHHDLALPYDRSLTGAWEWHPKP